MLEKSRVYASLLKERMDRARANMERKAAPVADVSEAAQPRRRGRPPKVAKRDHKNPVKGERVRTKMETPSALSEEEDDLSPIEQPALITGTKLKVYQLEGLAWMASLYENGISACSSRVRSNVLCAYADVGHFGR
jgi:ATP-dependent DNA helicase